MTILIAIVAVMSVVAFLAYFIDKRKAIKGAWRVPEATLIAFSLLGGAIGGYLAMFVCHHKTRKWYFHLANILGLIAIAVSFIIVALYIPTI